MEGGRVDSHEVSWEKDPLAGIIPRAMFNIFEQLSKSQVVMIKYISNIKKYFFRD